jgi:hypothetical protein
MFLIFLSLAQVSLAGVVATSSIERCLQSESSLTCREKLTVIMDLQGVDEESKISV